MSDYIAELIMFSVLVFGTLALFLFALNKFFPQVDEDSQYAPEAVKTEPAAVPPESEEKPVASALPQAEGPISLHSDIKALKAKEEAHQKQEDVPKPPTRWHMAPKATMIIELDLDRVPPSMALGSLLQMQDIVKAFYQEQAQKAAQLKNRIVKPSMVDRTEAILRRPS